MNKNKELKTCNRRSVRRRSIKTSRLAKIIRSNYSHKSIKINTLATQTNHISSRRTLKVNSILMSKVKHLCKTIEFIKIPKTRRSLKVRIMCSKLKSLNKKIKYMKFLPLKILIKGNMSSNLHLIKPLTSPKMCKNRTKRCTN